MESEHVRWRVDARRLGRRLPVAVTLSFEKFQKLSDERAVHVRLQPPVQDAPGRGRRRRRRQVHSHCGADAGTLIFELPPKCQKHRRRLREQGVAELLTIGFAVYRVDEPALLEQPLSKDFFRTHVSVARTQSFVNLREVTCRLLVHSEPEHQVQTAQRRLCHCAVDLRAESGRRIPAAHLRRACVRFEVCIID